MKLLGFNFTKIIAERIAPNLANINVSTKIDILDISEAKSEALKTKDDLVNIKFTYELDYTEKIAQIILEGNMVLSLDSGTFKSVLKQWKDKKISDDFRLPLFNLIIRKSNLKALNLEDDLGLPLHIQFPMLKKKD